MKRGGPIKRRRKKPATEAEREAMARFKAEGAGEPCLLASDPDHECDGPMERHHLISKSWLGTNFKFVERSYAIVWAPEIGVNLCRSGHERVTSRFRPVYHHEVPERARRWARRWECEWRLDQENPFFEPSDR